MEGNKYFFTHTQKMVRHWPYLTVITYGHLCYMGYANLPGFKKQAPISSKIAGTDSKIIPIQPINPNKPVSVSSSNNTTTLLPFNKFTNQDNAQAPGELIVTVADPANNVYQDQDIVEFSPIFNSTDQLTSANVIKTYAGISEKREKEAVSSDADDIKSIVETFSMVTGNEEKTTKTHPAGKVNLNVSKQNLVYYPLTIESVVNSYKPQKIRKKISWQLYVTPTVSYRRLSANKAYKNSPSATDPAGYPFASLSSDVNRAVTHKPDMGLEIGFSTRYPLSKNLKLRGGLQFNVNRYDIKAFVYNGEQATINLNGAGNNSVTAWTYYRNYNGYKTDWLKNFYFSVSAPIGAELTLFGNKKTSFGIAGTVQPTYILSDRAYLISTDYKNYAEVPSLIRNVNLNTSFETFINYTSRNKTKWQVGPQVRYQVLSSFQSRYPVRENLFDFGLKIGVTLNQ